MDESRSVASSLTPVLDGDILLYKCGFAVKDHEPVEFAYQNVRTTLSHILDFFGNTHKEKIFLSGSGNFRDKVATIKPYKGNRDPAHKPKYYKEIKQYLVDAWGAVVIEGREADDALGCTQWEAKDKSTCLVTTDKDLNMIPGYHYNWVKKELSYITLAEGDLFFWRQILIGDPVDNVQGVPGIGPKTAAKLLPRGTQEAMAWVVLNQKFKEAYGDSWMKALAEVATLLWIQRKEGQGPRILIG